MTARLPALALAGAAAAAAVGCGGSSTVALCPPWDQLALPIAKPISSCTSTSLTIRTGGAGDDAATLRDVVAALARVGFQTLTTARHAPDTAVMRRDRDAVQISVTAYGGSMQIEPNTDVGLVGSVDDLRREIAALRATFAPLATALPRATELAGVRACDDALLLRLDPDLAAHPIGFLDVDDLASPSRSLARGWSAPLRDAAPSVPAPSPDGDDLDLLVRIQSQLPRLAAQKVVIAYRVTAFEAPRKGAESTVTDLRGVDTARGTFTPGRFAATLVVTDRAGARPLCWVPVSAESSDDLNVEANHHGDPLVADFDHQISLAVGRALARITTAVKYDAID